MIFFNKQQYDKFKEASISGTGYLAFRDVQKLTELYNIPLNKVLDLGCGSGRSTSFLRLLSSTVYASDVSEDAINIIKENITSRAFVNKNTELYHYSPYSSIFSFFTFLHLTSKLEILNEYRRCYNSLEQNGCLFIVNAHDNLFYKKYESISCNTPSHLFDGASIKMRLKKINCEVENCYWNYLTLIELAEHIGFKIINIHFPYGRKEDNQKYIEEYLFPPYVYLIFKKL